MHRRIVVATLLLLGTLAQPARAAENQAAGWQTWVLQSAGELRPGAPPDQASTANEVTYLKALSAVRSEPGEAQKIAYWDAGAPTYRWVEIGLRRILQEPVKSVNLPRKMSLYMVAMYDATLATWDAKYAYNRPRPSQFDTTLSPSVAVPSSPSYPSEHAATASAAAALLGYLYPDDAASFAQLAEQAGQSRVLAGVQYPSDVQAGAELGRAVAARVIERARQDGFDREWTGSVPGEAGLWNGTNPLFPVAGTWKTWVLRSADQFRPGPPPASDSAEQQAELDELKNFARTFDSDSKALYAQTGDGILSSWYTLASQRMFERHLDADPPRAARVYALLGVVEHDAFVACWDAKYAYWRIRPVQLDRGVVTLFPTPNHPSYPAAHGCNSASMATMLAYLFPDEADSIWARANDNAWSRMWAGIHFRTDVEAGLALGRAVGELVVDHARHDGA